MNELIIYNYNKETQMTSVENLIKILARCKNFKEFFIVCSEMKLRFNRMELKMLISALRNFYSIHGVESITYLIDSIHADMVLPCNSEGARKYSEAQMKKEILNNFNKIFPRYKFIETEKIVSGIGRIDIYAEKESQPVIIELKIDRKNPNQQLIAYSSEFKNPILIGITELPLDEKQKIAGIEYLSLAQCGRKGRGSA